jgi:hypothetical protein
MRIERWREGGRRGGMEGGRNGGKEERRKKREKRKEKREKGGHKEGMQWEGGKLVQVISEKVIFIIVKSIKSTNEIILDY